MIRDKFKEIQEEECKEEIDNTKLDYDNEEKGEEEKDGE